MHSAHHAASSALSSRSRQPSVNAASAKPEDLPSPPSSRLLPRDLLDFVWLRMAARYGHAWVAQYGATPDGAVGAEWRETLGNLTAAQVTDAFNSDALRGADWPPSSGAFRALALGIPSLGAVRAEVRPGSPTVSAFTRAVWGRLDGWAYQRADADRADRMLREAYDLTRDGVLRGESLPAQPVAALSAEQPERKAAATPEQVAAHLAQIEADLRGVGA